MDGERSLSCNSIEKWILNIFKVRVLPSIMKQFYLPSLEYYNSTRLN